MEASLCAAAADKDVPVHFRLDEDDELECSTDSGSEGWHCGDDREHGRPASECASEGATAFSKEETLIIFDWDDTLFPTSWLHRHIGDLVLGDASVLLRGQQAGLRELAEAAERTLWEAASLGRVVIITNAVEGWVQDSCARFMPSLLPVVTGFPIISAQAAYEQRAAPSPAAWKALAFECEIGTFCEALFEGQRGNCISIGDSDNEHRALQQATSARKSCFAKCLKFAARPSLEHLVEQHHLTGGSLDEVVAFDGDVDVDVGNSA